MLFVIFITSLIFVFFKIIFELCLLIYFCFYLFVQTGGHSSYDNKENIQPVVLSSSDEDNSPSKSTVTVMNHSTTLDYDIKPQLSEIVLFQPLKKVHNQQPRDGGRFVSHASQVSLFLFLFLSFNV